MAKENEGIATRLSCFALISAIETDLRGFLVETFQNVGLEQFLPEDLRAIATTRRARDTEIGAGAGGDFSLVDYLDFEDLSKLIHSHREILPPFNAGAILQVAKQITQLTPIRNRVCHSRPLEFDDFQRMFDFATDLIQSQELNWREVRQAQRMLNASPAFALGLTIPGYWQANADTIYNNLPTAEFEDTGFIGRKKDVENLKKLLHGSYPVISIVGEGGVGKTALALKVLYDVLDWEGAPQFDAIVWVSLKTHALTVAGIQEIRGALTDALGLFRNLAGSLGMPQPERADSTELLAEIQEYLSAFRVLMALDNLETIGSQEVQGFLSELPVGCKVLITSRIGLGSMEFPYPLQALDIGDAMHFMRRVAVIQNQRSIAETKRATVERWCQALGCNPLAIKWFVAAVAQGRPPESLVYKDGADFKQLLQFSFRNVYESLGSVAKALMLVVYAAGRACTRTQIMILTEAVQPYLSPDDVDVALRSLVNASILRRRMVAGASDQLDVTEYLLGDFAVQFLQKVEQPGRDVIARVQAAMRGVVADVEQSEKERQYYAWDITAARWRTTDQRIVSARLRHAMTLARKTQYEDALRDLDRAQTLLPDFAEVRRIRGLVRMWQGDLIRAHEDLEAALQLDPRSDIARFTLALLLMHDLNDAESALNVLSEMQEIKESPPLSLKALALTRVGRLQEAAALYESLLKDEQGLSKHRTAMHDQAADAYRRLLELHIRMREKVSLGAMPIEHSPLLCKRFATISEIGV